jgi:subfamily B ATP-binding cassette protein HlyB/CyaB
MGQLDGQAPSSHTRLLSAAHLVGDLRQAARLAAVGRRLSQNGIRMTGVEEKIGGVVPESASALPINPGLFALTLLLRLRGVNTDLDQIRDCCGTPIVGVSDMLRCADELGLDTQLRTATWPELARTRFPAIASLGSGDFVIVAAVNDDVVVVAHQSSPERETINRARFEAIWDGRLVLIDHRDSAPAGRGPQGGRVLGGSDARSEAVITRLASTMRESSVPSPDPASANASESGGATTAESFRPNADDSALGALVMLLRFHGVGADAEQIRHRLGLTRIGVTEMVRCAKQLGLKAEARRSNWERLTGTPLPGIASMRDGTFLIVGKASEDKALVQRPSSRPEVIPRAEFEALWDGRLVLMARRASLLDLSRRFDITWFLGALHKYRRLLGEVLFASFFLQIFALISPLFFQVVIDKVLVHRSVSTLDVLIVGLVTVSIFETVLGILRTYVFAHTTNRIDVELGARLFRHLLALPIAYFQARRVGDSVARVRELENIRQFLTSSALTLVIDLLFTFVFLAVMFYYSPLLTGVVVGAFPFYIAISVGATPLFRRRLDEKFRRGAENQAFLVENVTGIETLKAMAVEPQMQRRWEEQLAGYVAASFRVVSLNNTASQAVQLVNKLVIAATLYFGAKLVIDGGITVGELVAFNMLSSRVSAPVLRLAQIWQDFHQARLSVARLGDILNTQPEPGMSPSRAALPSIRGSVEFEHVTFRYRVDAAEVLHDVCFSVAPGQVVGIVGSSGSGKSTLTKMVQRFFIPESGRVLIDGVDLSMVDVAWLRRQIGVVLQENILFNRSVRDNIALADPTLPMERVIAAAHLAGAHDFILELPEGYDTIIGERGNSLSGGQRQRIAIARALIADPKILIFDEATSALDYESERAIQQNMKQIASGRTVFIIAHRLSTVRRADRIITLERGRIIEDGSHDELIRSNGRYANLHLMQAGIHEIR